MRSRVISFSSGKGGVGKTSMVANLGYLYGAAGKRTLLMDGDWALGKLGILLGARPQWTIEKVLSGEIGLMQAICPVTENLSFMASPSGLIGFEEMDEAMRNQLFFEIDRLHNEFDVILFDHASGVSSNVLQFVAASHQQVIVTTPEPTSYTDAYAIMKLLSKRFGIRKFYLLVTQSTNQMETERVISRFSDVVFGHLNVRLTVLDIVPWEPKFGESIRKRQLFVANYPKVDLTLRLERIRNVLDRQSTNNSHGLSFFVGRESNYLPVG